MSGLLPKIPTGILTPATCRIREFVIGTGGRSHDPLEVANRKQRSKAQCEYFYGVLKLTLSPHGRYNLLGIHSRRRRNVSMTVAQARATIIRQRSRLRKKLKVCESVLVVVYSPALADIPFGEQCRIELDIDSRPNEKLHCHLSRLVRSGDQRSSGPDRARAKNVSAFDRRGTAERGKAATVFRAGAHRNVAGSNDAMARSGSGRLRRLAGGLCAQAPGAE